MQRMQAMSRKRAVEIATPRQVGAQNEFKNQNDKSKRKIFNLCSVILHFYFCFLHFEGICLEFSR
jgi:hypothetical protein